MTKQNKKDYHNKSIDELTTLLKEAREELFKLRLEASQFKLKNTSSLTTLRHDMARILSVRKEKEKNG